MPNKLKGWCMYLVLICFWIEKQVVKSLERTCCVHYGWWKKAAAAQIVKMAFV
jgi:hypothetical protein